MKNSDRVRIWNSFFHQARAEVLRLKSGDPAKAEFEPKGGRLTEEQQSILTVLALCTLAIEARANHLILEQAEIGKISEDQAHAAQRLPPLEKWTLLPRLAGKRALVKTDSSPHQAIAEICQRRNALVHVNFDKLTKHLPNKAKTISLFKSFVIAMEDMNVKINRGVSRPRKSVLKLANI
jgi:hypothetical protein